MSALTAAIPGPFADRTKLTVSFIASGVCNVLLSNASGLLGVAKGSTEFNAASYMANELTVWNVSDNPFGSFAADETVLVTLSIDTEQALEDDRAKLTLYSLETNLAASSSIPMPLNEGLFDGDALTLTVVTAQGTIVQNLYVIFDQALDYTAFYTLTEGVLTRRTYSGERSDNDILLNFSVESPDGFTDSFNGIEFVGDGLWERETVSCSIVEPEPEPPVGCSIMRFPTNGEVQWMRLYGTVELDNPTQFTTSFLLRNDAPSSVAQYILSMDDPGSVNYMRVYLQNDTVYLAVRILGSTYTSDPLPIAPAGATDLDGWNHVHLMYYTNTAEDPGVVMTVNQRQSVFVPLAQNDNAVSTTPTVDLQNNIGEEPARGYSLMHFIMTDGYLVPEEDFVTFTYEGPEYWDAYTLEPLEYTDPYRVNVDGRGVAVWLGDLCQNETRENYLFPQVDDPTEYSGSGVIMDPEPIGPNFLGYLYECQFPGAEPVAVACTGYNGQVEQPN